MESVDQQIMLAKKQPKDTPRRPSNSDRRFGERKFVVTFAIFGAVAGAVCLVLAWPAAKRLSLDRSIGSLFAPNDPTIRDYNELRNHFGGNSVVLLVYRDNGLMTPAGIKRNRTYTDEAAAIKGVRSALSTGKLSSAIAIIRPQIQSSLPTSIVRSDSTKAVFDEPILRRDDKIVMDFDRLFTGYTHSADHTHAAIVMILEPNYDDQTIGRLKQFSAQLRQVHSDTALVGEPVLLHDGFALIERDGRRLSFFVLGLLCVVMVVSLWEVRSVALSAVALVWTIVVTRALMSVVGFELSLVSTVFTAVVMVVVVASVLHLGVRTKVNFRRTTDRVTAMRASFAVLLWPIALTCLTDAAGFAALGASRIAPVRQFGWMIAIACGLVIIAVVLFGPLAYATGRRRSKHPDSVSPDSATSKAVSNRAATRGNISWRLQRSMRRLVIAGVMHRHVCVAIALAALCVSALGLRGMKTETSFLNNFRQGSPTVAAYDLVEAKFGGAGVWDVVLDAPPELSDDYLTHIRRLQADLRAIDVDGVRLTKVLSLADAEAIAKEVPLLSLAGPSMRLSGMRVAMPVFSQALASTQNQSNQNTANQYDSNPKVLVDSIADPANDRLNSDRRFRIMLRSKEQLDASSKLRLIAAVEQSVARYSSGSTWDRLIGSNDDLQRRPGRVTGYYVLMARLVSQLAADQWRCLAASMLGVGLILLLATRSLAMAVIVLCVNMIPVSVVLAVAGILGGKLNMGAAMIGAVSIGLSIDGSIHLITQLRRSRKRKMNSASGVIIDGGYADRRRIAGIVRAAGNVSLPIMLATIALVIGFLTMGFSDFVPTATFGLLVAACLVISMMTNLTLLPAGIAMLKTR